MQKICTRHMLLFECFLTMRTDVPSTPIQSLSAFPYSKSARKCDNHDICVRKPIACEHVMVIPDVRMMQIV